MSPSPSFHVLGSSFDPDSPLVHAFWTDPHISAQMLEAHLDPSHDAASRRPELRRRTLDWFQAKVLGGRSGPLDLVDLGCGPGLYTAELARAGHRVTGVDFSQRSLDWARQSAASQGLTVDYRLQSYLTLEDQERYDAALMIFCDLGALTRAERQEVLGRIHRSLRPGGTLVFDVWGPEFAADNPDRRTWSFEDGGFWSPRPHLLLEETVNHPGVVARRIAVWEEGTEEPVVHILRDYWFDDAGVKALVEAAGFAQVQVHHGILGPEGTEEGWVRFVTAVRP